jgi:biotin carboxyl carrier protein
MSDPQGGRRRSSSVLDAIYDVVDAKSERTEQATQLFRARALDQLDVATEIDNQLPLVARRSWLLLAGAAVLAAAFLMWAALTPSETSVTGSGRVVAAEGVIPVTSSVSGTVTTGAPPIGTAVVAGQPVGTVATAEGPVQVTAVGDGTIWQSLADLGSGVEPGSALASVLPTGSDRTVVLVVPESSAAPVTAGQSASINVGGLIPGTVVGVGAPLTAEDASQRYGLGLSGTQMFVPITVQLESTVAPGSVASGRIILSNQSVLGRILGRA